VWVTGASTILHATGQNVPARGLGELAGAGDVAPTDVELVPHNMPLRYVACSVGFPMLPSPFPAVPGDLCVGLPRAQNKRPAPCPSSFLANRWASPLPPSRFPFPQKQNRPEDQFDPTRSRLHHWLHLPQAPNSTGKNSQPLRIPVFPSILMLSSISGAVYSPNALFASFP
jgi:hypothetical protein